jgi:hypothetical protein
MTTIHAWFSAGSALRHGSSLYRKPDGSTVNVTRMSALKVGKGSYRQDETYVGEVIPGEDGGCVRPRSVVGGFTR